VYSTRFTHFEVYLPTIRLRISEQFSQVRVNLCSLYSIRGAFSDYVNYISSQDGRFFSRVSNSDIWASLSLNVMFLNFKFMLNVHSILLLINSLFGKPLNLASEVVILELLSAECFPCFYIGLNAVN